MVAFFPVGVHIHGYLVPLREFQDRYPQVISPFFFLAAPFSVRNRRGYLILLSSLGKGSYY